MSYETSQVTIITRKLSCDAGCGAEFTIESEGGSLMTLRLAAAAQGWKYIEIKVPRPDLGAGVVRPGSVKASCDVCPHCPVPEKINTTVDLWKRDFREVPVTINISTGKAIYGE